MWVGEITQSDCEGIYVRGPAVPHFVLATSLVLTLPKLTFAMTDSTAFEGIVGAI